MLEYKGFLIKRDVDVLPAGNKVSGFGIFLDGVRVSIAEDAELAKRYVDQRLKWPAKPVVQEEKGKVTRRVRGR